VGVNLEAIFGRDRVGLQDAHSITVAKNGRKIVTLVDALHEHREVRLPPRQGSGQFLKALWIHRSVVLVREGRMAQRNQGVDLFSEGKHGESALVGPWRSQWAMVRTAYSGLF
jgi:hypothetical protein